MNQYNLPSPELLEMQAQWLAEARSRLLRNAGIAHRQRVLDLGCGWGSVISELKRRAGKSVIALDYNLKALTAIRNANAVCADAIHPPFIDSSFDLIFSQNVFLWISEPRTCLKNLKRILRSAGAAVFMEPDYGGLMEFPEQIELRSIWIQALRRAGAEPLIGRKLVSWLAEDGWIVQSELLPKIVAPSSDRFRLLMDLPLTDEEKVVLKQVKAASMTLSPAQQIAHLPYFLIVASNRN
jgi:SAM-dependent methyltransferase